MKNALEPTALNALKQSLLLSEDQMFLPEAIGKETGLFLPMAEARNIP